MLGFTPSIRAGNPAIHEKGKRYEDFVLSPHVCVATLTQPKGGTPAFLLFSPDGKSLLSLGRTNYLWDVETKKNESSWIHRSK
jgi:hypothetical protein